MPDGPAEQHLIAKAISCHAFNKDMTLCAVCPNDETVIIYDTATWKKKYTLREHDQLVTGIDWAFKSNRIVTCSQDRNAYVWSFDKKKDKWTPTLVLLRANRAATDVRWSPKEDKFAVATGSKLVCICFFDDENDWWVSKHMRNHFSTVVAVCWHPNNVLLATASTDFRARVFCAWVKSIDKKDMLENAFKKDAAFGDCLAEYHGNGWVHSVDFSPSGHWLAYATHDSAVHFVDMKKAESGGSGMSVRSIDMPYRQVAFLSEALAVGVGYDNSPAIFSLKDGKWSHLGLLEKSLFNTGGSKALAKEVFGRRADPRGKLFADASLTTAHQNCISCVSVHDDKFATSGIDGRVCMWPMAAISKKFPDA